TTADIEEKIRKDPLAAGSVRHLRVKLHGEDFLLRRRHRRDAAGGRARKHAETLRRSGDQIPVAHPHLLRAFDSLEKRILSQQVELSKTILAALAFFHLAAQLVCNQLLPVTDAEYRRAGEKQPRIDNRAPGVIHA